MQEGWQTPPVFVLPDSTGDRYGFAESFLFFRILIDKLSRVR
ncbi:hypothetical protein Daudx_1972 [Candidatus Desulforudis audaxviator]|nr:hypothetical protein Daudx_1972 [Candidatus Desulforudis audaxviator]